LNPTPAGWQLHERPLTADTERVKNDERNDEVEVTILVGVQTREEFLAELGRPASMRQDLSSPPEHEAPADDESE
jgi:hypothetical protein